MGLDLELDFGGMLEVAFGKQTDKMVDKLAPKLPILNRAAAATAIGTSATEVFLDLGSPNVGRVWEVTSLTLYGQTDNEPIANIQCALYFGDAYAPSLASLIIPLLAVPSFTNIGTETLYCQAGENVVVGISGAGVSQNLGANVTYRDWPDAAISARNGTTLR